MVKNLPANAGDELRFNLKVGKIPWMRAWQPTLVFMLERFRGQRSLVGYIPKGHRESYMTEVTYHTHTHTHTHTHIYICMHVCIYTQLKFQ